MDSSTEPLTPSCSSETSAVSVSQNTTFESESSEMEVPSEALDQMPDKPDAGSPDSSAVSNSGSKTLADNVEKPAEPLPGAESRSESSQLNSTSNLYPILAEHEKTLGQVCEEKQATDSMSENPPCTETDSDASFVVLGKSSSEAVNNQPSDVSGEANRDQEISSFAEASVKKDPTKDAVQRKIKDTGETSAVTPAPLAESEASPSSEDAFKGRPTKLEMLASEAAVAGSTEGGAAGGKPGSAAGQGESVYYVKWILFNNTKVPIITQNENGPCPLLAIMNVLLLKGKVCLAPLVEMITSEQLMAHLGDCVVESKPKNLDEAHRVNYEQNMQDAMNLMYKLQTGLDVNVKFTGVSDFEYTSECIIFDLLEIGLYHGWLVDPQDQENVKAVGKCSYNQLVEKVIQNKHSAKDALVQEALIAEQFLDSTASQLTYHGLCELSSTVKEQELCVFFRNNHFSTMYKHNNELFLLVTDQGFLTESKVVWETLSNVDGDCHFVDANFCTYTKPQPSTDPIPTSPYLCGDEQINSDYQVALSLQHQDDQMIAEQEAAWGQFHQEFGSAQTSDHELALRLQEEEDRRAAAAIQEQRAQQAQGQGQVAAGQGQAGATGGDRRPPREREERREKKEGKDCCIL
ncbi:ubiquitin carboxyl-terminal hydrolase MINDY-1-like [Babylonia areolata]|uniref:ubiquitin carboxyl-terminal hydrolase MINDY-1-like n=1 Tax=Babylonia areolata TaxID=304850 RepID=UPI003FD1654C